MTSKDKIAVIIKAIETIEMNPDMAKLEGNGWKVYWVGSVLRVDITKG